MKLRERQSIFVRNVGKLISWVTQQGWELTFGETWRTDEQQALYVRRGLSKVKRSRHQDRLAIDLNLFIGGVLMESKEAYQPLGTFWKSLHDDNRWGGDFPGLVDSVHFEMTA